MTSNIHLTNSDHVVTDKKDGGNFTVHLNNSHIGSKPHAVGITSVTIAHHFPNINIYQTTLHTYHDNGTPGTHDTIVISAGQYTLEQLVDALNVQLQAATNLLGDVSVSIAPRSASNPYDSKIQWTVAAGAVSDFIVIDSKPDITTNYGDETKKNDLFRVLGMERNDELGGHVGFRIDNGITKIAQHQVDLGGPRFLHIHSRRLGQGNGLTNKGITHNIIETISLANTPYGGAVTKQVDDEKINAIEYDSPQELTSIDVYITDHVMRELPLPMHSVFDLVLRSYHGEGK